MSGFLTMVKKADFWFLLLALNIPLSVAGTYGSIMVTNLTELGVNGQNLRYPLLTYDFE